MDSFRSMRLFFAFTILFFSYAIASPLRKEDVTVTALPIPSIPPVPADSVYQSPDALLPEESFNPLIILADEDEVEAMEVSAEPTVEPLLPLLPADWPVMPTHLPLFDPESQDPIEKLCHVQSGARCCEHRFPCGCTSPYATPCGDSHACEDSGMCHCLKLVCRPLALSDNNN